MAACRADPEVAERRLTSATAAGLSRSSSETREIIQSWASHNHRVDHTSQPHSRSEICDCDRSLKNLGDNNAVMNYYVQSNRRETEQEEDLFSDNETPVCTDKSCNVNKNVSDDSNIGDGVADDYKIILYDEDNKDFNESGDECKADRTAVSNGEVERDLTIVSDNHNRASKTSLDDERCDDEQKMHIIREIRVRTAATDNRANGTFKSSCPSQDINKIIHSSKCERTTNIESRRDSADENKAGPMEINSTRGSGAYPHEDDIVVSVTIPRASSLRDFRNEATICKAVLSPLNKDGVRTTEETRRSATAMRNAIESFVELPNRKSRDEMDAVSSDERKDRGRARKCANCEEPRFSYYGQCSHLWKYSGYLNHDTPAAVYEAHDATKNVGDRESNSRLVAAPIAAAMLFRSRSLPRLSDSGFACSDHAPVTLGQAHTASRHLVTDIRQLLTLKQHYYPEGGWGWVIFLVGLLVQILSHGAHGAVGVFLQQIAVKFGSVPNYGMKNVNLQTGWLGAMSMSIALLISPITIAFCRRKSTRVTAVLGGLITALGCLFTSFATQFHQLFFSYGTVVGIGIGMTRDCSTLMVAQYFKRKRELVEIFIISGSGLGIAIMSTFIKGAISTIGWRLGLQAITGVISLTFILGTFYRSASLYHPQRRAILHLKNQKRKIKDKSKIDDRTPFFDFNTLRSKTVRILLVSTGISAFGINTPIFYLAHQAEEEGLGEMVVLLQTYLGLAWIFGCVTFGFLVVHRSIECRIARQYLMQAAVFVCGLCILAFTAVQENYHGYVMFAWIYGIFYGGYHYSLKMYTYEKVRARNFARTWGFVQCSQAIPIAIGVPISGYINISYGNKAGYYFSSTCVLIGSFTLFFIDLHKRNLFGYCTGVNRTKHFCTSDSCSKRRRTSFSQELENEGPHVAAAKTAGAKATLVMGTDVTQSEAIEILGTDKPELTCISEEGIADMDLPDNLFEDLDCVGDCITSCNKVENYLMLSEFENNLIAEMPIIMDRRGRRWSLARSKTGQSSSYCGQSTSSAQSTNEENVKSKCRSTNVSSNANTRMITVIDETSA